MDRQNENWMPLECAQSLELHALTGLPLVGPGADLPRLIIQALQGQQQHLQRGDILVVTSKLISRAEGRFVALNDVQISAEARSLAQEVDKDPALVELVLRESSALSRVRPGALIVRHRLGFVSANAAIDLSNARPPGVSDESGPWALLMPEDPDASARRLCAALEEHYEAGLAVVLSDSWGRPFRLGTVGAAVGVANLPPLWDQRGRLDLHGRVLEHTRTAIADQVAAAADLVAGQAAESRPVVLVRGITFTPRESSSAELLRPQDKDLYA